MMIQSVIFDLDGLLIDSEIVSYKIYQDLLAEYGHSFSIEYYARNFSGKSSLHNMTEIVRQFRLPISVEEGLALSDAYEKNYIREGIALKPGAKELLQYLKTGGYKISLASSSIEERAHAILRQHGVETCFDTFTFGYEVPNGKPFPDIFLAACEKADVPPEHSLVLEDSEAGIQAASSAGIPVICVPDMKRPGEEFLAKTLAVADSLLEVMDFLQKDGQNLS